MKSKKTMQEQIDELNENFLSLSRKFDQLIFLLQNQFTAEMMQVNNFHAIEIMELLRGRYDAERRLKDMELETWMKEHGLSMKPKP